MRSRRRSSYKLILFILLISISLGYAFLQTDLTIAGTSKITATSWDIHFNNVQITTGSVSLSTGDSAPAIDTTTHTDITYTVTLTNPGDFYEFTVDVVNAGTLDGMIDTFYSKMNGTTISTLPNYMNYSVTYDNDMPIKEKHLLASGITETIKVRLEYRTDINPEDLPTSLETKTLSFGISYIQDDGTAITRPTPPIIKKVTGSADRTAFRSDTYREKIKTITLGEEINPPENVVESWDIGQDQNGNVMAYVTVNATNDAKYDLYIQGDGKLYANPDSNRLFFGLLEVNTLNNIDVLDISKVTDMSFMFADFGYRGGAFILDLGDNFDTTNVTNMEGMFYRTGYGIQNFTLDLGDKFDTSKVTDMSNMFKYAGRDSSVFTLDLGTKFDTSNVTNMNAMFSSTGHYSTVFTLDLGDKFDTSNVTNMRGMFNLTGFKSTVFTLDLGDKFDTSNVTIMGGSNPMDGMFYQTGYSNPNFTLDLGSKFNTSKVTDMSYMFESIGHANDNFELDLSTFDFSNVTDYNRIFHGMRSTNKIWVKDATAQAWVIARNSTILTTSNVLIKGA